MKTKLNRTNLIDTDTVVTCTSRKYTVHEPHVNRKYTVHEYTVHELLYGNIQAVGILYILQNRVTVY